MVDHAGVGEKAVEGEHRQHGRHDRRGEPEAAHTPGERKEYLRGCGLKGDRLRSGSSRGQCLHGTYRGGTDRRIFGSDPGSFLFAAGKFRIYG